jgi:sec-independent protein translocase protein TatA
MMNLGPMELVIVLVIALLVLGPKRLPDAGRSVGKGLKEFKEAISGKDDVPAIVPVDTAATEQPVTSAR